MDLVPQTSLFLGIIPALVILYFSIKGNEGDYKEKTIFISFIIGIIIGFVSAVVRLITYIPLLFVYIITMAFFEQLIKTIILNLRRFHEKRETLFYGLSIGLGFGSVFTPLLIIQGSGLPDIDISFISSVAIGSFGIILFHGATGALIGYGIYRKKLLLYLASCILIQIPFNFLTDLTGLYTDQYYLLYQAGLVIFGLIVFIYAYKKIIIKSVSTRKRSQKTPKK
jgi:hypothetical protein